MDPESLDFEHLLTSSRTHMGAEKPRAWAQGSFPRLAGVGTGPNHEAGGLPGPPRVWGQGTCPSQVSQGRECTHSRGLSWQKCLCATWRCQCVVHHLRNTAQPPCPAARRPGCGGPSSLGHRASHVLPTLPPRKHLPGSRVAWEPLAMSAFPPRALRPLGSLQRPLPTLCRLP